MKIRVYYDKLGNTLSMMEINKDKNTPRVDMHPASTSFSTADIELTDDLAKLSILELHEKYKLDFKEKEVRLIPHQSASN